MMCKDGSVKSKLGSCAFGLALGSVKGLWLLLLAWSGWLFGYGSVMIEHIAEYVNGYGATFLGGIIGGVEGFVCGFIFGFIIASFYNFYLRCCCGKCTSSTESKK